MPLNPRCQLFALMHPTSLRLPEISVREPDLPAFCGCEPGGGASGPKRGACCQEFAFVNPQGRFPGRLSSPANFNAGESPGRRAPLGTADSPSGSQPQIPDAGGPFRGALRPAGFTNGDFWQTKITGSAAPPSTPADHDRMLVAAYPSKRSSDSVAASPLGLLQASTTVLQMRRIAQTVRQTAIILDSERGIRPAYKYAG